jgi:hypothetical protein
MPSANHPFDDFEYDWSRNPLWSSADSPVHRFVGDVPRALGELKRLYPPDVCREMVRRGQQRLIVPLFLQNWLLSGISGLVQLGHDLADCPGWIETPLRAELRNHAGYGGARFEVALWASLTREGIMATREPGSAGQPKADFLFTVGGKTVALEAKALGRATYDTKADEVTTAVSLAVMAARDVVPLESNFVFSVAPQVRRMVEDSAVELETLGSYLKGRRESAHQGQSPAVAVGSAGPWEFPGLGELRLESVHLGPGWRLEIEGLDVRGPADHLIRAMRHVRQKARHQTKAVEADLRVAVIKVPASILRLRRDALILAIRDVLRGHESWVAGLHWLVLVSVSKEVVGWVTAPARIQVAPGAPEIEGTRWFSAIEKLRLYV